MSHRVTCQFSFDVVMMLAYISALLFNIETQWWVSWSFLTLLSCCLFIFLWISAESWQLTPEVPEWWFSFFFSPSISISFWYFWKDAPADETSRASCHHHSWPNMQFFIHMHNFLYSFLYSLWISDFFFFLTWRAIRTWFIFYRKIIQCAWCTECLLWKLFWLLCVPPSFCVRITQKSWNADVEPISVKKQKTNVCYILCT